LSTRAAQEPADRRAPARAARLSIARRQRSVVSPCVTLTAVSGSRDLTSRESVEAVKLAFVRELGWYPREPPAPDYGIDLDVEAAIDGVPNGRILGVQIKGGASFFANPVDDGVVFRSDERHLEYWLGHSLPVVVVLYDPSDHTSLWQAVTLETVQTTPKGWKLVVPRAQRLDSSGAAALQEVVDGDPYTLRLNALRADLGWIRMVADGGRVWVDVAEWVNKTSGRGSIDLIGEPAGGGERLERSRSVYFGLQPYEQVIPRLFPWAELDVDEDLYAEKESELWELEESAYDSEEGRLIMVGVDFDEWRNFRGLTGLRPYEVEAGELARWRLVLDLNDLGRSLLVVDGFLSDGYSAGGRAPREVSAAVGTQPSAEQVDRQPAPTVGRAGTGRRSTVPGAVTIPSAAS
jgi:Domain of unknown function (DUF4365)